MSIDATAVITDGITEILAVICIFGLPIGLGMYMGIKNNRNKHIERMELIKQGIVPPDSKSKPTPNRYRSLRNGLLLTGIGLGLAIGLIITQALNMTENKSIIITACTLLFAGIAYTVFYILTGNDDKVDNDIE